MKNPECFKSPYSNELIENKIREAFDLIERSALRSALNLNISRTTFEKDLILEISNSKRFLRFTFDSEQFDLISADEIDAVITLDYTGQDLKPIRGKVINQRSFQGVVDKFYLSKNNWYILKPNEFKALIKSEEILMSEKLIIERILFDVFET